MKTNTTIMRRIFNAVIILMMPVIAQENLTPLEKNSFVRVTSHEELLEYIDVIHKLNPEIEVSEIGKSVEGRSIPLIHIKPQKTDNPLRTLVLCQQHGNEPSGKEAVLILLKKICNSVTRENLSNLDLYILPSVNPDGNEKGKRVNANGADLNRDHLILSQPETQEVHKLFIELDPDVTLDVHEYSAFRKEFREAGYYRTTDEQLGCLTNLNNPDEIIYYSLTELFPYVEKELKNCGFSFSNYYKMNSPSDTVRTSTTNINDGRQSFGIQNKFSFIFEGKNGRNVNDNLQRRSHAQLAAIESFLSFMNNNHAKIKSILEHSKIEYLDTEKFVITRMDYVTAGHVIELPMRTDAGRDTLIAMTFSPVIESISSVTRPEAYVIKNNTEQMLRILSGHGINFRTVDEAGETEAEIYLVKNVFNTWMENKSVVNLETEIRNEKIELEKGDVLIPLDDEKAVFIISMLEPSSMWGLVQYDEFSLLREINKDYPIIRIPKTKRDK